MSYLLQRLVVEETGGIFRQVQLLALDLLAEFPIISSEDALEKHRRGFTSCLLPKHDGRLNPRSSRERFDSTKQFNSPRPA